MYNDRIEDVEEVANNLLNTSNFGKDILAQAVSTYTWTDTTKDFKDINTNDIEGDEV